MKRKRRKKLFVPGKIPLTPQASTTAAVGRQKFSRSLRSPVVCIYLSGTTLVSGGGGREVADKNSGSGRAIRALKGRGEMAMMPNAKILDHGRGG